MDEIVAKETSLITIDLMDFIEGGLLREKLFREKLKSHDWEQYRNQKVLVKGCGQIPVPTWSYMLITSYLVPVVSHLMFGEACAAVPIFKRNIIS